MLTTNNPHRVHESLDPAQASLYRVYLAELFIDAPTRTDDRWIMLAVIFPTETSFHNPIQGQLVKACGEVDQEKQTEQCGNGGF